MLVVEGGKQLLDEENNGNLYPSARNAVRHTCHSSDHLTMSGFTLTICGKAWYASPTVTVPRKG